jgi:hypothetical protein
MAVQVEYTVHGVADTSVGMQAEVDGEQLTVSVKCFEVELVASDGRHGNPTLRFVGNAIPEAKDLFQPDATITATFA